MYFWEVLSAKSFKAKPYNSMSETHRYKEGMAGTIYRVGHQKPPLLSAPGALIVVNEGRITVRQSEPAKSVTQLSYT